MIFGALIKLVLIHIIGFLSPKWMIVLFLFEKLPDTFKVFGCLAFASALTAYIFLDYSIPAVLKDIECRAYVTLLITVS